MSAAAQATLPQAPPRPTPAQPCGPAAAQTVAAEPAQYLTFLLAGEPYAIGILAIVEIIEYHAPTPVPMMPACVRGVINLRGAVVPVIDPQARFGRPCSQVTKRSCIVIVEIAAGAAGAPGQVLGVVVDAVNEVIDIAPADIEPAPSFGASIRSDFIAGMGKVRDRFVVLLDVKRVLMLDSQQPAAADALPAGAAH